MIGKYLCETALALIHATRHGRTQYNVCLLGGGGGGTKYLLHGPIMQIHLCIIPFSDFTATTLVQECCCNQAL